MDKEKLTKMMVKRLEKLGYKVALTTEKTDETKKNEEEERLHNQHS